MAVSLKEIAASAAASLGYLSLKAEQELAIVSFLEGNDVFVAFPTGSLCYAALPHCFDELSRADAQSTRSIVVVVSPLIALMKDQVATYTTS